MSPRALTVLLVALSLGAAACAGLLGIRPRSASHPFEHRAHVDRGITCVQCHVGVTASGEQGELHLPDAASCRGCHEKPHDERACNGCHGEPRLRAEAELAHEHLRFEHRAHVPVLRGNCVRCHLEAGSEHPGSLRPTMASCLGCHHHQDQWTTRDCDGCHVDLPAEHVRPESHLVHDGDFLREHGVRAASARDLCASCHQERFCAGCHGATVAALPSRLAFDAPLAAGMHRAGFRSRHPEEARAAPGLCTTCHDPGSCQGCHAREGVAAGGARRGSPHPPGWLSTSRGGGMHGGAARVDPAACASCHGGTGEMLCVGCHRVGGPGGSPHGPGFASRKDVHRDAPCRLCHGVGP